MTFETPDSFRKFVLLDSGFGYRLEKWNTFVLARPDPQALWQRQLPASDWENADATFNGVWKIRNADAFRDWSIKWQNISFKLKLTHFKHVGLFAEQATHWQWISQQLATKNQRQKILNLFAYTGGATMVIAKLGH